MFIVGMASWWYRDGWKHLISNILESLERLYDTFSLGLLVKTLFSPWRQISAGNVRGPIGVQIRAFFDRLVSRLIGGFIRTITLIIGTVSLCCAAIFGIIRVALWPIIPALPVVFLLCMLAGWVPWHL